MSGWLIPPVTGEYTFWLASDDDGWFYLSADSTETLKRPFAMVKGYSAFQSWDEDATQKSQTFTLEAGKAYYIEGTHIENGGGDHLSVAWSGPGIARQVIPGSALAPAISGVALQVQRPSQRGKHSSSALGRQTPLSPGRPLTPMATACAMWSSTLSA
jgi:PA14 domain-containing protein